MTAEWKDAMEHGDRAYGRGDYATAIKYYTHAAAEGCGRAEGSLGFCFYYGLGVLPNKVRAREHWERGEELGDIRSLYKLGDMYENGDFHKDLEKSHDYYLAAFQTAVDSLAGDDADLAAWPNAFLRMLRSYPEEACTDAMSQKDVATRCVEGIQERIQGGDRFSHVYLMEAKKYLEAYEQ